MYQCTSTNQAASLQIFSLLSLSHHSPLLASRRVTNDSVAEFVCSTHTQHITRTCNTRTNATPSWLLYKKMRRAVSLRPYATQVADTMYCQYPQLRAVEDIGITCERGPGCGASIRSVAWHNGIGTLGGWGSARNNCIQQSSGALDNCVGKFALSSWFSTVRGNAVR